MFHRVTFYHTDAMFLLLPEVCKTFDVAQFKHKARLIQLKIETARCCFVLIFNNKQAGVSNNVRLSSSVIQFD